MSFSKDITGQRFGRLIAVKQLEKNKWGSYYWLLKCDCGNYTKAVIGNLTCGSIKSCGCLGAECKPPLGLKHGGSRTKLYHVWDAMRERCNNPNNKAYPRYGGRGITVCKEWDDFAVFREWANANGYVEGEVDIDRIDNDKGYSPENCRWTSHRENLANTHRKITDIVNGEELTLSDMAIKYGKKYRTIYTRYIRGKRGNDLIA